MSLSTPTRSTWRQSSTISPATRRNRHAPVYDIIVELDINEDVVSSWRQIGGDGSILREGQLPHNVAVTALYEMNLNAPLAASSRIATIELRYTSAADGSEERSSHTIRARDLIPQWTKASRRHRLATLGALWGEGLAGSAQAPEIAEKAQELAKQSPRDKRARELANAASATAGRY